MGFKKLHDKYGYAVLVNTKNINYIWFNDSIANIHFEDDSTLEVKESELSLEEVLMISKGDAE